jgi:hypothetical protein
MKYKVAAAAGWNGHKFGEIITDPVTDETNLQGQVRNGVLVEITDEKEVK